MNLRILSKHVERAQHMYDNGRDFFPLVKKKQKAEVNVEVDASKAKIS